MKKFFLIAAAAAMALPQTAQADIVVGGWDAFSSGLTPSATHEYTGVTATMVNTGFSNGSSEDRGSSSDGTWGSYNGDGVGASTTIVGSVNLTAHNGETGDTIEITLVNNGTDDLALEFFHMDALAFRPNASRTFTLDVDGSNVFTSASQEITSLGAAPNAAQDQHDEYDISLAGTTLAAGGGTVVLDLEFTGGTPGSSGHHLWLDNIAISGSIAAVPEPSSMAVLGLAGLAIFTRRRK